MKLANVRVSPELMIEVLAEVVSPGKFWQTSVEGTPKPEGLEATAVSNVSPFEQHDERRCRPPEMRRRGLQNRTSKRRGEESQ